MYDLYAKIIGKGDGIILSHGYYIEKLLTKFI